MALKNTVPAHYCLISIFFTAFTKTCLRVKPHHITGTERGGDASVQLNFTGKAAESIRGKTSVRSFTAISICVTAPT